MPSQASALLIAHRGESYDAPENTLGAVRLAWERGARAVEIDVRRTADDALVVIHDPHTGRLGVPRRVVAGQSLAQLRGLDAGRWKHRRWSGERIPLLAEVLATVPRGRRLFLELKEGPECVPLLAPLLAATLAPPQILVMSFHAETVAAAAAALPDCEICLLLTAGDYLARGGLDRAIARARAMGCRSLDVEVHRRLDARIIATVHDAGLALYTWTVNRVATARRLVAAGIDGITTDRCAWLAGQLGEA